MVDTNPRVEALPRSGQGARYINRELSWLDFNERVLAIAEDERRPLLERAKFLAIFSSNLDDFFQIRVAGLMEQVKAGWTSTSPDGMTASEQLDAIRACVKELIARQSGVLVDRLVPGLDRAGVSLVTWGDLSASARMHPEAAFPHRLFP